MHMYCVVQRALGIALLSFYSSTGANRVGVFIRCESPICMNSVLSHKLNIHNVKPFLFLANSFPQPACTIIRSYLPHSLLRHFIE